MGRPPGSVNALPTIEPMGRSMTSAGSNRFDGFGGADCAGFMMLTVHGPGTLTLGGLGEQR